MEHVMVGSDPHTGQARKEPFTTRVDAKQASSTAHVFFCILGITLWILHHILFTNVCSDTYAALPSPRPSVSQVLLWGDSDT